MALVFGGRVVDAKDTASWVDHPAVVSLLTRGASKGRRVPRVTHTNRRQKGHWSSALVIHTTEGRTNKSTPGMVESIKDWWYALSQARPESEVSWHLTVDTDGTAIQSADPAQDTCWHACQVNPVTDGWELVQGPDRNLTDAQLARFVELVDEWTYQTGIPRVVFFQNGHPYAGRIDRCLSSYGAGRSVCGIYGHRNVWRLNSAGVLVPYRGLGDPSDEPFLALASAGYKVVDVASDEDLKFYRQLQGDIGVETDGIWGRKSRLRYLERYNRGGVLVERPGDMARGVPAWLSW